jgi:hypothetical protein
MNTESNYQGRHVRDMSTVPAQRAPEPVLMPEGFCQFPGCGFTAAQHDMAADGGHIFTKKAGLAPWRYTPRHLAPYSKIAQRRDHAEAIYVGGGRHRA